MSTQAEALRLLGRELEDVREHIRVMKSELVLVEERLEIALNNLAAMVPLDS